MDREELYAKIKTAKHRIRVLGAVAFDLPYDDFKANWYKKINAGELTVEIICESESELNYDALISSDRKVSGDDRGHEVGEFLRIAQEPIRNLKHYLQERGCKHLEPPDKQHPEAQNLFIYTYYVSPKIPVINIDDDYYIGMALTRFHKLEKFEHVEKGNFWYDELVKYFSAFFDHPQGAKKYSTEYTQKGNKLEVIEMYNEKRVPLGQLPRDSFLDTTKVKSVIWGLIFDRSGRLLIHRRGFNAKDNIGMWDKSVGGHVDIEKDIDTAKAAARELLEELYSNEAAGQGGHGDEKRMITNTDFLIFLGEWRPKYRYDKIFDEMDYQRAQNYYFRLNYDYSRVVRESPREVLNEATGETSLQRVRAFVDLYVCVADIGFYERYRNTQGDEKRKNSKEEDDKLRNSKYLLLYPDQIKDLYKYGSYLGDDGKEVEYADLVKPGGPLYDPKEEELIEKKGLKHSFRLTPDLTNIINSELWENEISAFSGDLRARVKADSSNN